MSDVLCSIVIPTYRRPPALVRALASADRQELGASFEIVVVDNCALGSARDAVKDFAARARSPVTYVHEPKQGVAAARNRGVVSARGELVVFLDDDEEAEPGWLAGLVAAQRRDDADAVFGAVHARLESGADERDDLYLAPFSRAFPMPSGPVADAFVSRLGTGNSLFHRRALDGERTFDLRFNLSGGEDSTLIKKLADVRAKLVWCREARVREYVASDRATLAFLLERRFSAGQIRSRQYASTSRLALAKWMMLGATQAALAGVAAGPATLVSKRLGRRLLAEAAGGLGKVLFMEPFFVQRYK